MNKQLITEKIVTWMLAGNGRSDLIRLIRCHIGKSITDAEINDLLLRSQELLAESVSGDAASVVHIHVLNYEMIYAFFKEINFMEGMNKAMQAKEKLLHLVDGKRISITRNTEILITTNSVRYDEERLLPEEKLRLLYLQRKVEEY